MKGATLVLFCILAIHVLGTLQQQNSGNGKKSEKGLGSLSASNSGKGLRKKKNLSATTGVRKGKKKGKKPTLSPKKNGGKGIKKKINRKKALKEASTNSSKKKGTKKKAGNGKRRMKLRKRINRLKKMKPKIKPKKTKSDRQTSCSATQISEKEFEDMITCLEFERNQINNFKTQKSRVESQVKIVNSKKRKNELFQVPADNLALALGVNGTDVTNATCGDGLSNATTRETGPATALYLELLNCTKSVLPACESGNLYNETVIAKYKECEDLTKAMETKNLECKNKPLQALGTCWSNIVAGEMKGIKDNNCTQFSKGIADVIALLRTTCINTFGDCKKKEDAAVLSSSECSSGTVKTLEEINKQSIITKETLGIRSFDNDEDDDDDDLEEGAMEMFPDISF